MADTTLTYEQKAERLNAILTRLDNSDTPIDELARDVKEGVLLIKEMSETLRAVEMEVKDAFKELDEMTTDGDAA
jgi:exodeoxyribonuclease VII small subunit